MKKIVYTIVIVAVLAVALGTTGMVSAQSDAPQAATPGTGYSFGAGNRGARGNGMGLQSTAPRTQDGILHDAMIAVYAEALNLSVDELNAKLAAGETLSEIAFAAGLSVEDFFALKADARAQAIDQAVADGLLTEQQADWLKTRGAGQMRGIGSRGTGLRMNANPDCPYYSAQP